METKTGEWEDIGPIESIASDRLSIIVKPYVAMSVWPNNRLSFSSRHKPYTVTCIKTGWKQRVRIYVDGPIVSTAKKGGPVFLDLDSLQPLPEAFTTLGKAVMKFVGIKYGMRGSESN